MKKNTLVVFFILTVVLAFGLIRSGKLLTIFPVTNMKLISPAFAEGSVIPEKFTCKGENISPPLEISEVPSGTKSFVLILEDPDALSRLGITGFSGTSPPALCLSRKIPLPPAAAPALPALEVKSMEVHVLLPVHITISLNLLL